MWYPLLNLIPLHNLNLGDIPEIPLSEALLEEEGHAAESNLSTDTPAGEDSYLPCTVSILPNS